MPTLLLARHGETTWNRDGRLQGWAPTPLTDRGHEQARALAAAVDTEYDVDRIVASDLRRARQTASYLADRVGREPTFESSWRERDFGRYQGLPHETVFEDHERLSLKRAGREAVDARPESGESLRDVRERVLAGWNRLLADSGADETVAVVAHGGPLYLLLGAVEDRNIVDAVTERTQHNCALNELRVTDGAPTVVSENRTDFLDEVRT
ncbi:histidine phosphatase family protein [Haloplanus aerogenes]|uniref:Histidine phosphatase family protein n=1 Tax=Haloplanus aerogenes TaxID=660522 RepID=A0A3M0CXT0_9EURY|nr:histidine phosphatase family protein [Haloplanus aerogenes]AZH23947.1 histidine phosphatase family protein [Haloplanus aerogenes]RMB13290.1 putative phosphoglycerate mutase [Haloplanus aerogenes]